MNNSNESLQKLYEIDGVLMDFESYLRHISVEISSEYDIQSSSFNVGYGINLI